MKICAIQRRGSPLSLPALLGNRVPSPDLSPSLGIVGDQEPAQSMFRSGDSDGGVDLLVPFFDVQMKSIPDTHRSNDDFPLVHEGGHVAAVSGAPCHDPPLQLSDAQHLPDRFPFPGFRIRDRDIPHHPTGLLIEGEQPRVDRRRVHLPITYGGSPVRRSTAELLRAKLVLVPPYLRAVARVQRDDVVEWRGRIHDPVDHQWARLKRAHFPRPIGPFGNQRLDVGDLDLVERAVPLIGVVTPVQEPVRRVLVRVEQARIAHLFGPDASEQLKGDQPDQDDHQPSRAAHHTRFSLFPQYPAPKPSRGRRPSPTSDFGSLSYATGRSRAVPYLYLTGLIARGLPRVRGYR